ncbi:hypothetical protein TL16_g00853 [Triparma laevis f. inornata]|uniref:Uncharacterized protein n=1 Tax=Triparma laevis f. inornata TaxID=1714386 RepID=A0A9W6ZIQ8_9STRA|nr:hypothetical protein TL16_g00853 [Triparma laevis f. inornata]
MPSSSPLLPLLLVLLYLPPSLASITMCGQDYDSVGCGRINNVQFGFIVAIPLIIPVLVFYAVRYKDFSLPGHPSNISVSMSLSDRNVNFRRRSQPSALPQPGAESEACNFSFGVARGETLGPVTLPGGYNVKCDGGSGNDKLFAQVGEGEADVFKFKRDEVA